ncbi:bifunctional diguanylate cyclase/phosphodiesterase [Aliamphritea ceti]|uniref:bifunctional diguanylate cyclase/phosphodiesterase n=1 Tax=Aliamphritea ceti TaxID=1524258 RepID=UPI0021C391D5|nr:EAL domain-containing protein [Aliamphritea ceti]
MVEAARFISLKWRIFFILVLVLITVQGAFALFSMYQLEQQFSRQREHVNRAEVGRLNGSLDVSYERLLETAELISIDARSLNAEQDDALAGFRTSIERRFNALQLSGSVNSIYLYDQREELISFWGDKVSVPESYIQQVITTERPVRQLVCNSVCVRYVLLPLLLDDHQVGVMMVSSFLYDVIYNIKQQTLLDIGLALGAPEQAGELHDWGLLISSLTNRQRNQPILEFLSNQKEFHAEGSVYRISYQDRDYEVLFEPLPGVAAGTAYWLVLDDISADVKTIETTLFNYLLTGLLGIFVASVLMAMTLRRPLAFLVALAQHLPLLSQSEYKQMRTELLKFNQPGRWFGYDERDIVLHSTLDLTGQLERLETVVNQRTESLEKSRFELGKERDFLMSLLESAPMLILTQNKQGELHTLNHFGMQLLGLKQNQQSQLSFFDLLQKDNESQEYVSQLERLMSGLENQVRTDNVLLDAAGNQHDISWLHAKLRQEQGAPMILSIGMDISDRKRAERRLHWLANHDPLTERPNRQFFMSCLNNAIEKARISSGSVAVLFIDLDRFKEVNDSLGHTVGDQLLLIATQRINDCIRQTDLLARLGGDEFTVLLSSARDMEGVQLVANKILQAFQQPFLIEKYEVVVTVSIGISAFPDHGNDGSSLIKHADVAMFQAKDAGRNGYFIYDFEKDNQRFERFALGADLRKAIQSDQLVLHYQPQIDVRTDMVVGVEALVRWQHPEAGLLGPDRFISLAEELDLIIPLGEWVLREACQQMSSWLKKGFPIMRMAVNLAGQQIAHEQLIPTIERALKDADLNPEYLTLEVTESFIIRQPEVSIGKLTYLRDLGISLAMDDFGTGYSSLSYLKRLPIEKLKIDRSFIQDIGEDQSDESIIMATVAMCQSLQLEIIAEGVETQQQLDFITALECHYVQGYFYSKPLTAEALYAFVDARNQIPDNSGIRLPAES